MHAILDFDRRRLLFDLALGSLLIAISFLTAISLEISEQPGYQEIAVPPGPIWFLMAAPGAAVFVRRIWPIAALIIGTTGTIAVWVSGLPDVTLAAIVLLFTAVVEGRKPIGMRAAITAGIIMTLFTGLGVTMDDVPFYIVGLVALTCVASISFGAHTASRQELLAETEQHLVQARAHAEAIEANIVVAERNRIARELHDVVAHGLSVIVVQSGGAQRVLDRQPEAARHALIQVEQTARQALAEMRQVLGVLRADDATSLRPNPGMEALDELAHNFAESGLPVALEIEPDWRPPNVAIDAAVYRIVQESLTNVLKHGGTNVRAQVAIRHENDQVLVTVADDGRGSASANRPGGHGLRGMQERVELFGGTLRAGPRPGGGFEVRATLPLHLTPANR